jgi:hypothetical protein
MKPWSTDLVRLGTLLGATLLFAARTSAQFPKLNDLASEIAKEVKPLKPHLVAVVDFRPPFGSSMPQGHYFAWILTSILQDRSKKNSGRPPKTAHRSPPLSRSKSVSGCFENFLR